MFNMRLLVFMLLTDQNRSREPQEKAENEAVIKDSAESVEAINGAITALSDFYGKSTSFLQQPQTDAANTLISILETAQEDFEKLKQETEAAESDAAEKYEKFS